MTGTRKLRFVEHAEVLPPANLWEVLERGQKDAFPVHTALWLFKNAQGEAGAFMRLPGPTFGYRARDGKTRSTDANNAGLTLQALSWLLCLPAYGKGYLPAGPTAQVYGGLSEGFLEPPIRLPAQPTDLPADVRDLLVQATFPLSDLPTLTQHQIEYYITLRFIKHSTIFGPLETQLLRRAGAASRCKRVPDSIERDLKRAMDRAVQAFELAPLEAWAYDRDRHEDFIRTTRCRRMRTIGRASAEADGDGVARSFPETTSPYSPPYWGLPIFDLRPLFQEALRLIKLVPEQIESHPTLYFMRPEDWQRCFGFRKERRFAKGRKLGTHSVYPRLADQRAAWDWLESIYGARVRSACYPSDRAHK